jgi:(R,R)-butanediol dehydrogenase / meso-butanediol dehydrogenase / diacetyl reductase
MKSAVWHGPHDVRFGDVGMPSPEEGEVLIKVSHAGICGSDLSIYRGKHWRAKPPLIMGHEFSGSIAEVGSSEPGFRPGDPVVVEPLLPCGECYMCQSGAYHACKNLKLIGIDVDGAFAEYVKAPAHRVYKVPEAVSPAQAALVEPTAVAVHAVKRSRLKLGDKAVVLGAGPIGLLVAQVARVVTSRPVEVVEIGDWRLERARELGFDPIDAKVVDPQKEVLERTEGRGADVLFDAAGAASTAMQQPMLTRIHGQVVMVAMPKEPLPVDLTAFALREIELIGVKVYDRSDYDAAISLVADRRVNVEALISHVLPLEQAQEGLELALQASEAMKVLIKP